jgi:hypothetical protein
MSHSPKRITGLLYIACCVLAGCGAGEDGSETVPPPGLVAAGDSVFSPPEERVTLSRDRIYYTLTIHDWYARGEPLVHEGRGYRPSGMPIPASVPEMRQLGEFRGVEYYARDGDSTPSVYVPVFEGYWQRFSMADEVIDTTMTAPPPPDPDTTSSR